MKIQQLLAEVNVFLTNEEKKFVKKYPDGTCLHLLDEHNHWVAQNLVRKGVYLISNDNDTIYKK